jgi:serine/threonine-protein kinase RsbW
LSKKITIACDTKRLPDIRKFLTEVLAKSEIDDVESHKLVLAVDEICANLIIHANHCDASRKLNVSVDVIPHKKIIFSIRDQGNAFDFSQYKEPSLDQIVSSRRKGGLGLILVRRIMDNIEFTTEKNYNICRLVKKL